MSIIDTSHKPTLNEFIGTMQAMVTINISDLNKEKIEKFLQFYVEYTNYCLIYLADELIGDISSIISISAGYNIYRALRVMTDPDYYNEIERNIYRILDGNYDEIESEIHAPIDIKIQSQKFVKIAQFSKILSELCHIEPIKLLNLAKVNLTSDRSLLWEFTIPAILAIFAIRMNGEESELILELGGAIYRHLYKDDEFDKAKAIIQRYSADNNDKTNYNADDIDLSTVIYLFSYQFPKMKFDFSRNITKKELILMYINDFIKNTSFIDSYTKYKFESGYKKSMYCIYSNRTVMTMLIVKNKKFSVQDAQLLIQNPESVKLLNLEYEDHKLLANCISNNTKIESISKFSIPALLKLKKDEINSEFVTKLLIDCAKQLQEETLRIVKNDGVKTSLLSIGLKQDTGNENIIAKIITRFEDLFNFVDKLTVIMTFLSVLSDCEFDKNRINDFIVLFCHYFIPNDIKKKFIDKCGDKELNIFQSNLTALALNETNQPLFVANMFDKQDILTKPIFITIINNIHESDVVEFIGSISSAKELFKCLETDAQVRILTSLAKSGKHETISNLTVNIDANILATIAGSVAVTQPLVAKMLIEKTNNQNYLETFLNAIPSDIAKIDDKFFSILKMQLQNLKSNYESRVFSTDKPISIDWSEDQSKTNFSQSKNIWIDDKPRRKCRNKDHIHEMFICHTCGSVRVCINCATKCHKGHDLVYKGKEKFKCRCKSECKCLYSENEQPKTQNLLSLKPEVIINTIMKLSKGIKENNHNITSKFNENIRNVQTLNNVENATIPPLYYKELDGAVFCGDGSCVSVDLKRVDESFNNTTKKLEYSPLRLMANLNNFITVASGCTLRIMNSTLSTEISSTTVNQVILNVSINNSKTAILATTLYNCYIIEVGNNGIITQKTETELNLRDMDGNLYIYDSDWMIDSDDTYFVVTTRFVKFYKTSDNLTPHISFMARGDSEFLSCTSFIANNTTYGLMTFKSGKVLLHKLDVEGEVDEYSYNSISLRKNSSLDYSRELNMIFCNSFNDITIYRPNDFINGTNTKLLNIRTDFDGVLRFMFIYPNTNICLFAHTRSCAVFTLEFGDETNIFSKLHNNITTNSFPALDNQLELLGTTFVNDKVYSISRLGKAFSLTINSLQKQKADAKITSDMQKSTYIHVPPSFWVNAEKVIDNVEVTCSTGENINCVLHQRRYIYKRANGRKYFKLKLNDSERAIVGFATEHGSNGERHMPVYISAFGRNVVLDKQRKYFFALMPGEIAPRNTIEVSFTNTLSGELNFDGLDVYTMKWADIANICSNFKSTSLIPQMNSVNEMFTNDWMTSNKLTAFNFGEKNDIAESCFIKLAKNFEKSKISDELFTQLIHLIYTNNAASSAARYIASICDIDDKEKKWSNAAISISDKVSQSLQQEFWRDFSRFEPESKIHIANNFITNNEVDADSLIAAFYTNGEEM